MFSAACSPASPLAARHRPPPTVPARIPLSLRLSLSLSRRVIPTRSSVAGGGVLQFESSEPTDGSGMWWQVRRGAAVVDGNLQLTSGRGQKGMGWFASTRPVWPNFAFTFDFQMSTSALEPGDGFCFVIHNDPRGNLAEGNAGDGLGLGSGGATDTAERITRSFSICIDANMAPAQGGSAPGGAVPFPRTPESSMAIFVSQDGRMNCQRTPGERSGCAFPLRDLTLGSSSYTMSVSLRQVSGTNHTLADFGLYDVYTGDALGNWNYLVPDFYNALGLRESFNLATVGFTGATGAVAFAQQSILSYYWGARDAMIGSTLGGNADLYVGVSPPNNVATYTNFAYQSVDLGADVVEILQNDPVHRGVGGTYYAGVYCAGPSGCTFTVEATAGVGYATMSPSPRFGLATPLPSITPSVAPERRLSTFQGQTSTSQQYVLPQFASYFAFKRQPGYQGPMTVYLDQTAHSIQLTPRPVAFQDVSARLELSVSRSPPTCPGGSYIRVPFSAGNSPCAFSGRDPEGSNPFYVLESSADPVYPVSDSDLIYVEVKNRLPLDMGNSGNVTFRVRLAHDLGPSPAPAAADGMTTIIIAVVVAGVVLAGGLSWQSAWPSVILRERIPRASSRRAPNRPLICPVSVLTCPHRLASHPTPLPPQAS